MVYEVVLEIVMSPTVQRRVKEMFPRWIEILWLVVSLLLAVFSLASADEVINLAWDPSADASGYKIYYGKASRVYEDPIDVGNATSHPLELPIGKWYIAITAYDASYNESSFSDEVSWPIQVFTPAPGEAISSGSSYPITWYGSSLISSFKLSYSVDGGATWSMIRDDVTGTSYDWDVPTPLRNKRNCLLRVTGFDGVRNRLASDSPDGPFTIEVVKLLSPKGGEILTSGDYPAVTWQTYTTKRNVASTEVLLTRDGGTTWTTVHTESGNPEGFNWDVPVVKKSRNQCKLKVVLKDADGKTVGTDASDGYFTIRPY
jgi:hypothetical protein